MSGKIIFHIGPPKTATTSLQIAMEGIGDGRIFYAGTIQPRDQNKGSLCHRIYRICANKAHNKEEILNFHQDLRQTLDEKSIVFFSEEMFLVESKEVSAEEKLKKLRGILEGFDCRILITMRRAESALPSYYQEIFESLPLRLRMDFSAFCRDNRALCYDYTLLHKRLCDVGFKDVGFLEFEYLASGKADLGALIGDSNFDGILLDIQKYNVGRSGSTVTERAIPKVSLKSLGSVARIRWFVDRIGLRRRRGYKTAVNMLDRIALRPAKTRKLVVPTELLERFDASYEDAKRRFDVVGGQECMAAK
ncbi:MAG: hypothetical protein ACP5EN_04660 [Rhodovulum sp.]